MKNYHHSLLVLHGASGLPPALVHETIKRGVCKFNVNTEVRAAAMRVVKGASSLSVSQCLMCCCHLCVIIWWSIMYASYTYIRLIGLYLRQK